MRTRIAIRLTAGLLGLCAAAGLYVLGRATAHSGTRAAAAYARGLAAGRDQGLAQGRAEGEADGETHALSAGARGAARTAYTDGYRAGAEDVFTGYDGGWSYAVPYVVTLARGGPGVTYRFGSRTAFHPGVDYYLCPGSARLCRRPHR